jgi:hypothetical protein
MNGFTNYHLAISRRQYERARAAGKYERPGTLPEGLDMVRLENPSYDRFASLLKKVGEQWGWTRRPRYVNARAELTGLLARPDTALYVFRHNETEVGYAMVNAGKADFSGIFPGSADQEEKLKSIIEIENFGLFPEHTGRQYGRHFLAKLFETLFQGYDIVYLSSRSTNHSRVIPFYEGIGMRVLYTETLPDDLLPAATPLAPLRRQLG